MSTLNNRSFSGGEITPSLYARVDTVKYQTGLRTCRNNIVMRHGGAANRPGTMFICEVKDSTDAVKLIPFVFNATQTYILEFGDQYMRVIKDGVQLTESAKTITGVTQANPAVVTITSHGYTTGDEVYISGVVGMTELNNRNFKITVLTANTFSLQHMNGSNLDSSSYTAYSSGGSSYKVYQITTPYASSDLATLNYAQSADIITLVHPSYAPRELSRTGHTSWSLSTITFAPTISQVSSVSVSGAAGGNTYTYSVTAIDPETGEESLPYSGAGSSLSAATSSNPHLISWSTVSGVIEYNVYYHDNGVPSFVGVSRNANFYYYGTPTPDTSDTPPSARNPFNASNDYPSTVSYYQQRIIYANTNNNPETVYTSRIGHYYNFTRSSPSQSDDALTFTLNSKQVNQIKHLIDIGTLVILTSGGEWAAQGGSAGVLTPTEINAKQYTYNGSSNLSPIVIGGNALYIQARGSIIRDLGYSFEADTYRGNDLTIYSAHLFDGYSIVDWSYQQVPHSIVWCVRDDGTLLGLTYVREQEMLAWHRHDFDGGTVENVCVIPEGNEDYVYLVIKRTVDGVSKKYIERLSTRFVDSNYIEDSTYLDSYLTYDGRNTSATTMTLSGGADWTYDEDLTLTASASTFASTDVGNAIHLKILDASGYVSDVLRCTITSYTSATVVTVNPHKTVPASLRSTATSNWDRAVDVLSGLWHLEGKDVSVFADGFVVASPYNESYTTVTVVDGTITLDKPYGVIHVGLPYISDIETLDIDTYQGETIVDKNKNVGKVSLYVEKSRGGFVGSSDPGETSPLDGLFEVKVRNTETMESPVNLKTGIMEVNIRPEWNSHGRVFIRQVDPIPLTILAVAPSGVFPFRG